MFFLQVTLAVDREKISLGDHRSSSNLDEKNQPSSFGLGTFDCKKSRRSLIIAIVYKTELGEKIRD